MRFTGDTRLISLIVASVSVATPAAAQPAPPAQQTPPAQIAAAPSFALPPPTQPPLGPEATALRAAMEAATANWDGAERADVLGFYAGRGFEPFWSEAGRGAALVDVLEDAPAHGLPPARYKAAELADGLTGPLADPDRIAALELAAARSWLLYARDLTSGLLTPVRVDPEINVKPPRPERVALLARLDAAPLPTLARELEPKDPDYRALKAEKARLEAEAAADWGAVVPEGPTLRLGDRGERVEALRARLAARGFAAPGLDAPTPDASTPDAPTPNASTYDADLFDEGLKSALERFQVEAGLEPDGLAGRRTVATVNAGPEERLRQVLVNLERLRWTNVDPGPRYIAVNIPDYTVKAVEDGRTVFTSRVVVGMADDTRTPEFSDVMSYFVVNPTWHIPDSIAQRVYLPKLKKNPNTLANSNMRIFTRSGTEINPGLVDFSQFSSGNFPFRIKQNPSDANALGRVKFMFPNQFSIYLHDTPHRELFAKAERAFSNGCIRVEQPLELAYLLLQGQVPDPQASFDGWLAAKTERTVQLQRPIPVTLEYRTVFVDDAGRIQQRFDVYGRDAEVFRALEAQGVTLALAQG